MTALQNRTAAAHERASAVFGNDDSTWSLRSIPFTGTLGPGPDGLQDNHESAVKGGPRNQQHTSSNPWLSAKKSLFPAPDKIKKGETIIKVATGEKFRIADIRNIPGDPLINFQIHV